MMDCWEYELEIEPDSIQWVTLEKYFLSIGLKRSKDGKPILLFPKTVWFTIRKTSKEEICVPSDESPCKA